MKYGNVKNIKVDAENIEITEENRKSKSGNYTLENKKITATYKVSGKEKTFTIFLTSYWNVKGAYPFIALSKKIIPVFVRDKVFTEANKLTVSKPKEQKKSSEKKGKGKGKKASSKGDIVTDSSGNKYLLVGGKAIPVKED